MIEVKGLCFDACHGVLAEEKSVPQKFVFDVALQFDAYPAMTSDDVNSTVNYAEVCECIKSVCCGNSFDLIERLAYSACRAVTESFPAVQAVTVTVHKPQAPVPCTFSDISFTCTLERVKAVLSLGSNQGDRQGYLHSAIDMLGKTDGIKILKVSDSFATAPYGGVATGEFLNCACLIECLLPARQLLNEIHRIESALGRVREQRWGNRTLDIDIVFFGDKVIEEEGLVVPHPDYFNRDFVLAPVKQIVPDFVCPLRHVRVADLKIPT